MVGPAGLECHASSQVMLVQWILAGGGFGFSAHGFQLGPAVGEALADLVMSQQPRIDLKPFSTDRLKARLDKNN